MKGNEELRKKIRPILVRTNNMKSNPNYKPDLLVDEALDWIIEIIEKNYIKKPKIFFDKGSNKPEFKISSGYIKRPSVEEIFKIILNQEPRGLLGNTTGGGTMINAYPEEYKLAQALHDCKLAHTKIVMEKDREIGELKHLLGYDDKEQIQAHLKGLNSSYDYTIERLRQVDKLQQDRQRLVEALNTIKQYYENYMNTDKDFVLEIAQKALKEVL